MFLVKLVLRLTLYVIVTLPLAAAAFLAAFIVAAWLVSLPFGGMQGHILAVYFGFLGGLVAGIYAGWLVILIAVEMYFKRVLVPAAEPYFSDKN